MATAVTPPGGDAELTRFLVDTSEGPSQVIADLDGDGNLLAHYIRGAELLAAERLGESHTYHADGLGSVRALTDSAGAPPSPCAHSPSTRPH